MLNNADTGIDPKELERTKEMWRTFTNLAKYGTISIVVLLVLMSWFLL